MASGWIDLPSRGVTSINGLSGALTLAAGTGITIDTVGNTLTVELSFDPVNTYVPYAGAIDNVNLNTFGLTGSYLTTTGSLNLPGSITLSELFGKMTLNADLLMSSNAVYSSALNLTDPGMGGSGSVYLNLGIYHFRDAAGLDAATLQSAIVIAGQLTATNATLDTLTLNDLTNPGASQLTVDQEVASFRLSGDLIDFKASLIYGNSFKLYDGNVGEYNTLQVSEGSFGVILPDSVTLADLAASKIRPAAGVSPAAIDVANYSLLNDGEEPVAIWAGDYVRLPKGYFAGISDATGDGGFFKVIPATASYAAISAASYDVNDEFGGSTFFSMNPEEGIVFGYAGAAILQGNATQIGLYVGSEKIIEGSTGGVEIGTGLGQPIYLNGSTQVFGGPGVLVAGTAANPSIQFPGSSSNTGMFLSATDAIGLSTNGVERFTLDSGGHLGLGGGVTPTAYLHLRAGSAATNAAPLKFTSGTLNTTAEVGAYEFLTDKWYGTITTGAARKEITLNDIALTSTRIPFSTTNGRLTDSSNLVYVSNNLGVGTGATVSARIHSISTTEQLRAGYDASNYWNATTSSVGVTTLDGAGSGTVGFTFAKPVTVSSLTASKPVFTDANKVLVSGSFSVPQLTGSGNLTGQAATAASVATYTTPNDATAHTFRVGAYTAITAISAGTLTVTATFTDQNNTAQTVTFFPMGITTAGLSATGFTAFTPATIRCKANTAITLVATFAGVSVTYDVGGTIESLY